MSRYERYTGPRERTFSRWHRTLPHYCTAIDIDFLEYCDECKAPLALLELARDVGQEHKPTTIVREIARRMSVPAFLIFYEIVEENEKIGNCRIRQIWPPDGRTWHASEDDTRRFLTDIHDRHVCERNQRWSK